MLPVFFSSFDIVLNFMFVHWLQKMDHQSLNIFIRQYEINEHFWFKRVVTKMYVTIFAAQS